MAVRKKTRLNKIDKGFNMERLKGKVAIVTGASSGIGEGTAELFAKEGATVVLTARRVDRLNALAEKINKAGSQALVVPGDVTKVADVKNVIEQTIKTFGKIDILVNNAGISDRHTPVLKLSDEFWDEVITTDLTSVFHFCREALTYMVKAKEGVIVNVSSIGGVYGNAGVSYSAAKAGVIALTQNIGIQYAGTKIRCNTVCPGPTPTELNTPEQLAKFDQEFMAICARHTDHSVGDSEVIDQANAILFLASDESRCITGQSLVIDRGMCL
jgi:NAD(P)-dependent dehydrogenase (short-subunit alcohol dehydrogenase family)